MSDAPGRAPAVIVPMAARHRDGWERLYRAYAAFYAVPMTDEILGRTWGWLMDPGHPEEGLAAEDADGTLVGLAHFRPYPDPLRGCDIGFFDDLFVDPSARGRGIARQLIETVATVARQRGWPQVSWLTAEDNASARALYDQLARATTWVTYEMLP